MWIKNNLIKYKSFETKPYKNKERSEILQKLQKNESKIEYSLEITHGLHFKMSNIEDFVDANHIHK